MGLFIRNGRPLAWILSLVVLASCTATPEPPGSSANPGAATVDAADLVGHWVHSFEEQAPAGGAVAIYRPADSGPFPPSRFRMQYIFEDGGGAQWYFLAPDDGHHFRDGSWQLTDDRLTVVQGDETVTYRIHELDGDVLRLEQIAP